MVGYIYGNIAQWQSIDLRMAYAKFRLMVTGSIPVVPTHPVERMIHYRSDWFKLNQYVLRTKW